MLAAAGLVAAGNVISRLIGFVREPVIAAVFGASTQADAFEIAARVPNTLLEVAIGGAVSAVLVPLLAGMGDGPAARRLTGNVASVTALLLGLLTIGGLVFTDQLVALLAPDLPQSAKPLAAAMLRFTIPAALLLGISAVVTARLIALERFVGPAFSISALNSVLVVAILALTPLVGPVAVAVGYLVGAGAHLAVQLPGLFRAGVSRRWPDPWADSNLRRAVLLYLPVLGGLLIAQVVILVETRLATSAGEGSLAMMRYATRLQQFPLGVIVAAIALALLPPLAQAAPAALRRMAEADEFKELFWAAARILIVAIVPVTIILVLAAEPVIRIVYERGQFQPGDVAPTALALVYYSVALPLIAIDQLLIFSLYAARNTIAPAAVGVVGVAIYLLVAFPLAQALGFHGLVLANSIQNGAHAVVLGALMLYLLRTRPKRSVWRFAIGVTAAAAAAGAALWMGMALAQFIEPAPEPGLVTLVLALPGTALAYFAVLQVFGVKEPALIWAMVSERLMRR